MKTMGENSNIYLPIPDLRHRSDSFARCIFELIDILEAIDNIGGLKDHIVSLPLEKLSRPVTGEEEYFDTNGEISDQAYTKVVGGGFDFNALSKYTGTILGLADRTKDVTNAFDELYPSIRNVKTTIDFVDDLKESIAGISEIVNAGKKGLSAAGVLEASADVVAGAIGVAEASAALGPGGWIIGLGSLAVAGIAYASSKSSNQQEKLNFQFGDVKRSFWEAEKQKDREKLIDLYNVHNYKQLDDVEKELNSNYMVADRMRRVNEALRNQEVSFPNLTNKWVRPDFRNVRSDVNELFSPKLNGPLSDQKTLESMKNDLWEQAVYDGFGHPNIKKYNEDIAKLQTRIKTTKQTKNNQIRLATENDWELYRRRQRNLPIPPEERNSDKSLDQVLTPDNIVPSKTAVGRTININLNRPMIEHFTINAKEMKEGVDDFKHKVEEVLLEILNSANVIQ
jgi:hypothetical protein